MSRIGLSLERLRSPLALRLIFGIILVSSAITLVLTLLQLYAEYRGELGEIEAELQQIESAHLKPLTRSLWATDSDNLRLQVEGIVRLPNLEYVAVREGGKVWAAAGRRGSHNVIERQYAMSQTHLGRTLRIGTLTAVASLDAVYDRLIDHALLIVASNAVKTFWVAGFAFWIFQSLVNRHLLAIADYFRELYFKGSASRLKLARPGGHRPDELDQVCAVINLQQEKTQSMQAALEESEAGLHRAQSMAKLAYLTTAADGSFASWSPSLPLLIGVAPEQMPCSTREWLDYLYPEDRPVFRQKCIDAGIAHARSEVEYRLQRPDGAWMHVSQTMEPLEGKPDAGGRSRWFNTLQDVTEQKRAAEELTRALEISSRQQEQLVAMARRLSTLQEKDRRDIARELHDRVGQNLTVLGFNLQHLRNALGASDAVRRKIADSQAILQETGATITDVLTELKPPMLANYGLFDALRFHAREFSRRTGLPVDVEGRDERFAPEFEMTLFRIALAALNNAARHAGAKRVRILLASDGRVIRLEISDDGSGFDAQKALASGRWGLAAMRERAEALDGVLRIDSAPGRGTRIIVELGGGG